jgi:hypothetical protein
MKTKHAIHGLYGIAAVATAVVSLPALAITFTAVPGGSFTAVTAPGSPAQILKAAYSATPVKCDMAIEGMSPASISSNGVRFLTITKVTFSATSPGTDPIMCPMTRARTLSSGGTLVTVSVTNPLYGTLTSYSAGVTNGYLDKVYLMVGGAFPTCGPGTINLLYVNPNTFTLLHPWSMGPDCSSVANINLSVTPSQTITSP